MTSGAEFSRDTSYIATRIARDGRYPEQFREEIDTVDKRVFTEVNNGVYR